MIDLRALLYRVAQKRPDRPDSIQMESMLALQQAARDMLRQTLHWKVEATGALSDTTSVVVADPADQTVNSVTTPVKCIRVTHVEIDVGTIAVPLWRGLTPVPLPEFQARRSYPLVKAIPGYYADNFGVFETDVIPNDTYPYKAIVAVEPADWFEAVELPFEFENGLVEGALAEVYDLAGELHNPKLADHHKQKFWMRMTEASAASYGTSGNPQMHWGHMGFGPMVRQARRY